MESVLSEDREPEDTRLTKEQADEYLRFVLGIYNDLLERESNLTLEYLQEKTYETLCMIGGVEPEPLIGVGDILENMRRKQ